MSKPSKQVHSSDQSTAIAVLGGTFDPIHYGHLRLANYLADKLKLKQVKLMPGYQPVHRGSPQASSEQRLAMLELAIDELPELIIDTREIHRKGPSYTIISLKELRAELGEETPIYFILGEDAFCQFDTWHQWQSILDYAHLLIAVRPTAEEKHNHGKHSHGKHSHGKYNSALTSLLENATYHGEGYPVSASGTIVMIDNPMLDISSSDIRIQISEHKNITDLVPANVSQYIEQHKLYCS